MNSIPAFMRLSALKLRYKDTSFISRLGLTEREVAVLQQVRAAARPGALPKPELRSGDPLRLQ